jgi:hypothetical protein
MPTGQVVINGALSKLGLLDPGTGTPSTSDSTYALAELNNMWAAWGIDEGLIYAVLSAQFPLSAYVQWYTIGSGATFNQTQVPSRIYKAFIVDSQSFTSQTQSGLTTAFVTNTSGLFIGQQVYGSGYAPGTIILGVTTNTSITTSIAMTASASGVSTVAVGLSRNELKIVEATQYYSHNDLAAAAATPEELYPDYNVDSSGYAKLYVWPVANEYQANYLEIDQAVPFTTWALAVNYNIPQGFQDMIEWALAFRCLAAFGEAVSSDTAQVISAEGGKAEARIRVMNAKNRQLPEPVMAIPGSQTAAPAGA